MSGTTAIRADRVLTAEGWRDGACVVVEGGRIAAIADRAPAGAVRRDVAGALVPGFVDLQANGGGGVLFNDVPTVDGLAAIAAAHRALGTTGLLPTLISDDLEVVARALHAVDAAIARGVPGVLGIHLEGPFLNPARKGIHPEAKFRRLDAAAVELLATPIRGRTLVTLAPEMAPPGAIRALVARGVTVAAGHTQATYDALRRAIDEGLRGFTHLYNAMSPLGGREPGAVGAALDAPECWVGAIVDGHHVHPAALRIALAAKGPERFVLVSDAMPTVGSAQREFTLAGRRIVAREGRCAAEDGTLAGSDLDLSTAVGNAVRWLGVDLRTAVRMASAAPARAVDLDRVRGAIAPGLAADFALLDDAGRVTATWVGGEYAATA